MTHHNEHPPHENEAVTDLKVAKAAEKEAISAIQDCDIHEAEAKIYQAEEALHRAEAELKDACPHHREIHFTVDAEHYETRERELTPDRIIREFGDLDPKTHYLVQIRGHEKISYQGKGHEPIKMHNGMCFQIISTGPTPVSDRVTGPDLFINGLRKLGYEPTTLPNKPTHVMIKYGVPSGKHVDQQVQLGFVVPLDFPLTPPGGLHVSPGIHPIHPGGLHPTGGIHASNDFGSEWRYWSRPFPGWGESKKTVATYMSYIWRLWDSQ